MASQQVGFALADCVIEISPEPSETKGESYTAFLSLVEDHGSVVRPFVSGDGHRVRIRAGSEPLALYSAISYLRARFGAVNEPGHPCDLSASTVGRPIAIED